jgi:hypothetical protein
MPAGKAAFEVAGVNFLAMKEAGAPEQAGEADTERSLSGRAGLGEGVR